EIKNISEKGYQTVKLKMSNNFEDDRQLMKLIVKEGLQIRLDANSNSNFMQFLKLVSSLDKLILNRIEYVEDPFKFKIQQWQQAKAYLNLAVDFEKQNVDWSKLKGLTLKERPFSHLILKPAREDVDKTIHQAVEHGIKVTITSSMDHFVGALHALSLAASLKAQYGELIQDPGCLTFNLYNPEPFSQAVINDGPQLFLNEESKGYGIGFDRLFSAQPWVPLHSGNSALSKL
ncbi:MAG TPA: hypothetical protein PLJ21_07640, partial [Pseudobdellovibrionaceae bacterium]|nr:hypothetical protein [Pseudobdellovibrionaceae bacterium]